MKYFLSTVGIIPGCNYSSPAGAFSQKGVRWGCFLSHPNLYNRKLWNDFSTIVLFILYSKDMFYKVETT